MARNKNLIFNQIENNVIMRTVHIQRDLYDDIHTHGLHINWTLRQGWNAVKQTKQVKKVERTTININRRAELLISPLSRNPAEKKLSAMIAGKRPHEVKKIILSLIK